MNLLILPFDHRSSFSKKILRIQGKPDQEETKKIQYLKHLIFEAFLDVRKQDKNPEELGILVDEQYGEKIIKKALSKNIKTAVGVEKSGQEVFQFEHATNFREHIEKLSPTFVKVLVRYNPENKAKNKKQLQRLKKLSDFCTKSNRKLLFELLVPPTEKDNKSSENFDTKIRPIKTRKAITEIKSTIRVDIWKLEGFNEEGWNEVLKVFKYTKGKTQIIVLGRGEDSEKVEFWLKEAAKFDETIGFAIGRTIFMEPLLQFLNKKTSEKEAKEEIANNYQNFINIWRAAKSKN